MIIGKVLKNGQVTIEREFDTISDFILADYLLHKQYKLSYTLYYNGNKIGRLKPNEGECEVGFPEETEYLNEIIKMINSNKMFT